MSINRLNSNDHRRIINKVKIKNKAMKMAAKTKGARKLSYF